MSADWEVGRDPQTESARFRQIGRLNCPDQYLELTFRSCSLNSLKQGLVCYQRLQCRLDILSDCVSIAGMPILPSQIRR